MTADEIFGDDWEWLTDHGEVFSLDVPAHLLAYVRAKSYEGAQEAERWRSDAMALHTANFAGTAHDQLFARWEVAAARHAAYLRVLAVTIELYARAPQEETRG